MTTKREAAGAASPDPTDEAIARSVKLQMALQGLTVADVSYNAHIPISTLYRKLNGSQSWKSSDIQRVARYLKVSPNDLFFGAALPTQRGRAKAAVTSTPDTKKASGASTRRYSPAMAA